MSKINSDFLKKTIHDLLAEKKQRKFLETVELQVGMRDYDPEKRFNGSIRLPNIAYNKVRVNLYINPRFVSWPTLFTLKKLKLTTSHTLMLMDLKLSTRIKPKLKNGPRNTTFFLPLIQLPSKSPNFWVTSWSSWTSSQLLSLKEKNSSLRLMKSDTPSSSNQRKPHASVPPSEPLNQVRNNSDKTSPCQLTS